jgi:hypothetical protein
MTKRVLAFTFILASIPFAANAASKNSAHVVFSNAVTIGNTEVPKGSYKVVWTGTEPNVQVTFTNGKWSKTVPAHLVEARNNPESQTVSVKGDKTFLNGLELHDATLAFGNSTQTGE